MSFERRLNEVERQLDPESNRGPFIVVDHGEAPEDPDAREAWFRSRVPAGVTDYIAIRVVREDADEA
jgi:hypothetical protein